MSTSLFVCLPVYLYAFLCILVSHVHMLSGVFFSKKDTHCVLGERDEFAVYLDVSVVETFS